MKRPPLYITIADDDLDDQLLIKEAIKESEYPCEVNSVYNGLQLMDFLLKREHYKNTAERPHIIFLDLNMPLMGGLQVLKEISSNSTLKAIPVYVLSTSSNFEDRQAALDLGAKKYLVKPANFNDLQGLINNVVSDHTGV